MLTTDYEAETVNHVVPPSKDTFKAPLSTFNVAPEAPPIVNVPGPPNHFGGAVIGRL